MQIAHLFAALSTCFVPKGSLKGQNGVPDADVPLHFLAPTPCENEIFGDDGEIMPREGSHNVKKRAEIFTYREK